MQMSMSMNLGAGQQLVLPAAPVVTTTTLPDADEGVAYSTTLAKTGAAGGTWTITSGTLPTGLTINASTGEISGTPTVANTFNFTARYTDPYGQYDDQALACTVNASFDPYSYTTMNLNMGFRAGDVTITDTDKIDKVANTGDGDLSMCATAAARPAWVADGGNGKPCAVFDGSDDYFFGRNAANSANATLDGLINNDSGWLLAVVKCTAANVNTDQANPASNDPIFIDENGYVVMSLRDTAGAGTVYGANWDGGYGTPRSAVFTFGEIAVVVWKHTGGNLTLNLNGSEGAAASSGTTDVMTTLPRWFGSTAAFLGGQLYHFMADDAVPADEAAIIAGMLAYYADP